MQKCSAFVWDNIDFLEETKTEHGITHSTSGIIIQQKIEINFLLLILQYDLVKNLKEGLKIHLKLKFYLSI